MDLQNTRSWQNPIVRFLADISFALLIVIGFSISIELCRRILIKRTFLENFVFRVILLLKSVSDMLLWLAAFASFSLERYIDRSSVSSPSSSLQLDVYSHILIGAGWFSALMGIIYCCLKVWELALSKNQVGLTTNILLTFSLLVVVGIINILMVGILRVIPSSRQTNYNPIPLIFSFTFWMDIVTLLVLFGAFILFVASQLKKKLFLVPNDNKRDDTNIKIGNKHQDAIAGVKVNISVNKESITAEPSNKRYNYTEHLLFMANSKLCLLLLGAGFTFFLFICIFMFQKTDNFISDETIVYSFFSTSSVFIVTMVK